MSLYDSLARPDSRIHGIVRASVTNNQDPDKLGRVRVSFPWLSDTAESGWAPVATPLAGNGFGLFCLPEPGDEVLVMFDRGDVDHPYVVGALWNAKLPPPADNGDGKNNLRLFRSRSGHLVQLDDSDGKEQIVIRDKSGKNEIVFDTASDTISIHAEKDLAISAKGDLSLKADGDIAVKCASFKLETDDKVELAAKSDMKLGCGGFALEAKQKVEAKAQQEIALTCMAGVKLNNDGLVVT